MGNTYTQLHIQAVFAVQNRLSLIKAQWEEQLHKYLTGILASFDHKPIIINGMPDHIHMVFGLRPTQSISDLMEIVKTNSSKWINQNGLSNGLFRWQKGYGAFSYSKSQLPTLINYVKKQKEHHHKATFLEEYVLLLKEFGIEYDERYVFHDPNSFV